MCRDVVELLRLFLNVSVGSGLNGKGVDEFGASGVDRDEDMEEEKSGRVENQNPNQIVLSELACWKPAEKEQGHISGNYSSLIRG